MASNDKMGVIKMKDNGFDKEWLQREYWDVGKSARKIAQECGRDHSTILHWMRKYEIERMPVCGRILIAIEPSGDLSYLLGLLKGDGCVDPKTGIINFASTKAKLARICAKILSEIGLRPSIYKRENRDWSDLFITQANSVNFARWYSSLSIPRLYELVLPWKEQFVRGFYEAEGSLHYRKQHNSLQLYLGNTQKDLLLIVDTLIQQMGFETKIKVEKRKPPRKDIYKLLILGGNRRIIEFLNILKPAIKNEFPLGATKRRHRLWIPSEIQYLKEHYSRTTYRHIATKLGRTKPAIELKARDIGLRKMIGGKFITRGIIHG